MYTQYDVAVVSNDDVPIYYPLDSKEEAQVIFDSIKMVVKSGQLKRVSLLTRGFMVDAEGDHVLVAQTEQSCEYDPSEEGIQ